MSQSENESAPVVSATPKEAAGHAADMAATMPGEKYPVINAASAPSQRIAKLKAILKKQQEAETAIMEERYDDLEQETESERFTRIMANKAAWQT